jgi:hypothetical protein
MEKITFEEIFEIDKKFRKICNFTDRLSQASFQSQLKKVCTICTRENQRKCRTKQYVKSRSKDLALIQGNGSISNFLFNNNKNFMNENVVRFMIRGRTNILWRPERRRDA